MKEVLRRGPSREKTNVVRGRWLAVSAMHGGCRGAACFRHCSSAAFVTALGVGELGDRP